MTSGIFSGMGGCAMIGQSLINISSGARTRISSFVASILLLVFIMFGSGVISVIPMAALTGVMIMVAIGTFEWASFRVIGRMPDSDIFVMILVTLVTVFVHNLALAVFIGVVISALAFAWDNAKNIRVRRTAGKKEVHYEIIGPLFFGSVRGFDERFDIEGDPENVYVDFAKSRVADMSAIEELNKLTEKYLQRGKKLHLQHLSSDCQKLLKNADQIIEVNVIEDPIYHVAANKVI